MTQPEPMILLTHKPPSHDLPMVDDPVDNRLGPNFGHPLSHRKQNPYPELPPEAFANTPEPSPEMLAKHPTLRLVPGTLDGYGPAWLRENKKVVSPVGERVAQLVDWWVDGIYHAQEAVLKADWSNELYVLLKWPGEMSTFDFAQLTRLVVGAHDLAIRVQIEPLNMRYLTIYFHPRERVGSQSADRHPTIEMALKSRWRIPRAKRRFALPTASEVPHP